MAPITRSALRAYEQSPQRVEEAVRHRVSAKAAAQATVFLSHSHLDQDLVKGAINFLANQGVVVYVDWLDQGMPADTSRETAARIKQAIQGSAKFVLLATEASLASRWVPWELGCADGIKGAAHMAVLGVREDNSTFKGNEYVALYPTIQEATGSWAVVLPGQTQGGTPLARWFRQ